MPNEIIKTFKYWPNFKERFMSNLPKDCFLSENKDTCWEWQGYKKYDNYGTISWGANKEYLAHRISYFIFKGNIPYNQIVRHTCDNKICVNPNHLLIGTLSDNSIDCVKRNRHPSQKLNSEDIKDIKWKLKYQYKRGLLTKLAKLYHVDPSHISNIKNGHNWSWVKI